jgi:MerT mercuric transport protein
MIDQAGNRTSTRPDFNRARSGQGQKLLAAGGLLGALAASSCCLMPLVLFGLGVSGIWIGTLTRLAPYQPYFLAATAACLGGGYWLRHRSRTAACTEEHRTCCAPSSRVRCWSGWPRTPCLAAGGSIR